MLVFEKKADLTRFLTQHRQEGKTIGLVPTMGALHQGHLSLIKASSEKCELTVCSIFVNPTQFNNKKDLEKYPRTVEKDKIMLEEAGCGVLFFPSVEEIYTQPVQTKFYFGPIEEVMEGFYRPEHFQGVGLVVSKFFNIIQPNIAFFGQKDLQQCRIIQQMTSDLSFNLQIEIVPTIREDDGLAMSSRNIRLSPAQRQEAPAFYQALCLGRDKLFAGNRPAVIKKKVEAYLADFPQLQLEYFCIADGGTLQAVKDVSGHDELALCIAGYAGEIRLIDNLLLKV